MAAVPDAGRESRLYRAQSRIQRAAGLRRAGDPDGRFIFYWIAFNALYGQAKYLAEGGSSWSTGCAKDGSSANRASLEPAVRVMARLVPLFWATVKQAGAGEDWGPLSYPAWGRPGHPEEKRTRCFVIRH